MSDLFGKQPRHKTGTAFPDFSDPSLEDRVTAANLAFRTIWVPHAPQMAVMSGLRQYRLQTLGRRGVPLPGRRLSQETQAGKSALVWRLKEELEAERIASGLGPNPYQVVIITIDRKLTLKGFYQEILKYLGDEFYAPATERDEGPQRYEDRRSYKVLERRIAEWVNKLGVELLVADEAQRLDRNSDDASDVTERIQTFLDRGVVPLLLVGNGKSPAFFEKNPDLSARLGTPLQLKRLQPSAENRDDAKLFKSFCRTFDEMLVATCATTIASGLHQPEILNGLLAVSGGHVGRVARLLEEALPMAVSRGAVAIEAYDLSNATRQYAIGNGWIDHDPFSDPK